MTPDYTAVLTALYPDAQWTLDGSDYAGLTWLDDSPKPTRKTLDAAWPQVDNDRQRAQTEQARRARYQVETDGMFFAAQREGGDLTEWTKACAAVKADLPYPDAPVDVRA